MHHPKVEYKIDCLIRYKLHGRLFTYESWCGRQYILTDYYTAADSTNSCEACVLLKFQHESMQELAEARG